MREDQARVQLQAGADAAAMRGSLLFHLDLAAALGVQALHEAGIDASLHALLVDDQGYGVVALDASVVPQQRAVVRFAADGRPQLSAGQGAAVPAVAARARAAATVARAELIAERHSVIAIPQRAAARHDDPVEVYALALPDAAGDIVLGIHWHAEVSGDGTTLLAREALSQSALTLPARRDTPPFGIEVTHMGAVPSEIHGWLSLKHGLTLSVATLESGLIWTVDGERITLSGRLD